MRVPLLSTLYFCSSLLACAAGSRAAGDERAWRVSGHPGRADPAWYDGLAKACVDEARYRFDAEAAAPWLHVLLRYEGPEGINYALAEHERTAYWAR